MNVLILCFLVSDAHQLSFFVFVSEFNVMTIGSSALLWPTI